MSGLIDVHCMETAIELDIIDSAIGRSESTVRVWDKQRAQGRQRRHHTAPVYRATIRMRKGTGIRAAGTISSARGPIKR